MHVPKTGGSWVRRAIITAGIPVEDYRLDGTPHTSLAQCPCPEKFKFGFVRHPVDLYRSYWQYKMTYGWDPKNPIDIDCRDDNFHGFIRNVLKNYPGFYGQALTAFLGEGEMGIEFVGKYENLVEDLISALKIAGEIFEADAIRNLPPCNVSNKVKFPAVYTEALERDIRVTEKAVFRRFGYH